MSWSISISSYNIYQGSILKTVWMNGLFFPEFLVNFKRIVEFHWSPKTHIIFNHYSFWRKQFIKIREGSKVYLRKRQSYMHITRWLYLKVLFTGCYSQPFHISGEDTLHFIVQICSLVAKNYQTNITEKS